MLVWYTFVLLQSAMAQGMDDFYAATGLDGSLPADAHGFSYALITCVTAVLCGALLVAAARLRMGLDVRDYLGLRMPGRGVMLHWLVVAAVVVVLADVVIYRATGELAPGVWIDTYLAAGHVWFLWLAMLLFAPVFEELFFRGFLFEGLRRTLLGGWGTVVVTALVWTWVHEHQGPLEMALVLLFGVVLGIARLRTGSLAVVIGMHVLSNLVAMIELAWAAGAAA